MNDPKSVLRTVTRVIEAELKPEAVVILVRMPDEESYIQPGGDNLKAAALVFQAAARVAVTFGDELKAEATEQKEEQK
jgi:hypothetical protein